MKAHGSVFKGRLPQQNKVPLGLVPKVENQEDVEEGAVYVQ
jgi:hypothetical protein